MSFREAGLPKQPPHKRLARGPENEPIVLESETDPNRYVYSDGTVDAESTVDERFPVSIVGGFVAKKSLEVIENNVFPLKIETPVALATHAAVQ